MRGRWLSGLGVITPPFALRFSRGVSTIELAVVLSVTLVMVGLAVSAYRTHSVRRDVISSLAEVTTVQNLVTDAFQRTGVPPASESDLPALEIPALRDGYIEALTIDHGRIELQFGQRADKNLRGRSLSVSPFETMDGEVLWLCGNRSPDVGLYPLGLFSGASPPTRPLTTVDRRYLPPKCR